MKRTAVRLCIFLAAFIIAVVLLRGTAAAAALAAPSISSPTTTSIVSAPSTIISWTSVPGAKSYQVRMRIAGKKAKNSKWLSGTSAVLSLRGSNFTIYWQVRARNSRGKKSGWSHIESFKVTTACVAYLDPQSYSAPANGGTVAVTAITYSLASCKWQAVANASWLSLYTPGTSGYYMNGTGISTLTVVVDKNYSTTTRSGYVYFGGVAFKVKQAAASTSTGSGSTSLPGTWTLYSSWKGMALQTDQLVISSNKTMVMNTGDYNWIDHVWTEIHYHGTWTISGTRVVFTFVDDYLPGGAQTFRYEGNIVSLNRLEGEMVNYTYNTGTWYATKQY